MDIKEICQKLEKVVEIYDRNFEMKTDNDVIMLKLQEELGELTERYMQITNRKRNKGMSEADIKQGLSEEMADVISFILILANRYNINIEEAIECKWFKYLK